MLFLFVGGGRAARRRDDQPDDRALGRGVRALPDHGRRATTRRDDPGRQEQAASRRRGRNSWLDVEER